MRNIMQAGIGLDRDFVKGVVADTIDNMWKEYSMTVYHDLDYIYQTHLRDALLNSQGLRDENPDLVKGSKAYQEKKEYEEVGKQFQKELENENGLLRQFERGSEKARFSFMLNVWKKAF